MKFVFKVLVLVALIVLSKLVDSNEQDLVAVKAPVIIEQSHGSGYQTASEENNQTILKASDAKVEKASLQF